jgi:hypothetical protein
MLSDGNNRRLSGDDERHPRNGRHASRVLTETRSAGLLQRPPDRLRANASVPVVDSPPGNCAWRAPSAVCS